MGRNTYLKNKDVTFTEVALLAEGVGRNGTRQRANKLPLVALLAEGVGRNLRSYAPSNETPQRRPPRGGRG